MITTPDHDDAVTTVPAASPVGPNPHGFWQDCDSATGQEGTTFRAEEFNEAALNLRDLVNGAGVAPVKLKATMLLESLHRLYAGSGRSVVATTTLVPDDAGLILVDATAADLTITLPSAAASPKGRPMFQFVRIDTSTHVARVVAAAGQAIRTGVFWLDAEAPSLLRSDGVNTWHLLSSRNVIRKATTINVSLTGVAQPVDPLGGDAFDSLQRALAYLRMWQLRAQVTIQIAAGTYPVTTRIDIDHLDAQPWLAIYGAGAAATILQISTDEGFKILTGLYALGNLTIKGISATKTQPGLGVYVGQISFLDNVTITGFGTGLFLQVGTVAGLYNTLTITNNLNVAVSVSPNAAILSANFTGRIVVTTSGATSPLVNSAGYITLKELNTDGGMIGLQMTGAGCMSEIELIRVYNCTSPASAILVTAGAVLRPIAAGASKWDAALTAPPTFHTFRADRYGYIYAANSLTPQCRAITSPAVNTVGNVQGYVEAV